MSQDQSKTTPPRSLRRATIVSIALLMALSFAFFAGIFFFRSPQGSQPAHNHSSHPQRISAAELEEQFGLRVTLIGVTAAGGMVDFRYKVLNAEKAEKLLGHHENMPQLIPAGSQTRLGIPGGHSRSYLSGKVYYMLYGNAGGIVKPGTPVEVAFGDLILEAIPAQ